jgi:glycosyltransferase involved in cell wall biosynthesis
VSVAGARATGESEPARNVAGSLAASRGTRIVRPGVRLARITPLNRRLRILYHLQRPPFPINGGDGARVAGFLDYFRDRRDAIALDAVGTLPIVARRPAEVGEDLTYWLPPQREAVLRYVERLFINEQTQTRWDRLSIKPRWLYHRRLRGEELPVGVGFVAPPSYRRFVLRLAEAERYDVLLINYIRFAALARAVRPLVGRTLIDIHDVYSASRASLRTFERGEAAKAKFDFESSIRREVGILGGFAGVIVNSAEERDLLIHHGLPAERIVLVPHLSPNAPTSAPPPYASRTFARDLLYVGSSYRPNVDGLNFFMNDCLPRLRARHPSVTVGVAGSVCDRIDPAAAAGAGVRLLGFVDDLAGAYATSRAFICPLLSGAGTKVKLLEALAAAMPIVTTTVGASGLELRDGANCRIADGAAFTDAVANVLADAALAARLAATAGETHRVHYSKSAVYAVLDRLFGLR